MKPYLHKKFLSAPGTRRLIPFLLASGLVLALGVYAGATNIWSSRLQALLHASPDASNDFSLLNPLASRQTAAYQQHVDEETRNMEQCRHQFSDTDQQIGCMNRKLREIARTYGARFSLDVIEPLAQKNPFMLGRSHDFSHTIGNYAIAHDYGPLAQATQGDTSGLTPENILLINKIGKALVDCDGWGAFGCYHGVIEAGLSKLPPIERTRVVKKACLENALIQSRQYYVNQCIHWFGHGMAIFTNQTLQETLAICESMNKDFGSDDVQLCLSGVFHAGSVPGSSDVDFLANVRRVYDPRDVYFPCRDLPERFRGQCFSHIPGRTGTPDMKKVFTNCNNIPENDPGKKRNYMHRCYNSGANILLVNADFSAQGVIKDCHTYAPEEYRGYCYEGAVRYWILRDPLMNNQGPFAICQQAEASAKRICYRGLGAANYENYFSKSILSTYCKQIREAAYYTDCTALNIPDII